MKSLVKNVLGDKTVNMYLPMTHTNAHALMESIGEGTFKVFELIGSAGNEDAVTAYDIQVQFRNSGTGKKGYLRGIVKATWNPDEIQDTLVGETINGILIDEVVIISFAPMSFV